MNTERQADTSEGLVASERRTILTLIVVFWLSVKLLQAVRNATLHGLDNVISRYTGHHFAFEITGLLIAGGISYAIYLVQRHWRAADIRIQVAVAAACAVGFVLAITFMAMGLTLALGLAKPQHTWLSALRNMVVNGSAPSTAYTAAVLLILRNHELRLRQTREAELEHQAQEERLRALRYQVDPHFLHNSLNSLSSLILDQRSADAESMALGLSRFFRSSLAFNPSAVIPLAQEVQLQHQYLELERIRVGDCLTLKLDIPDHLSQAFVPNLILQPLVENTVKHALASVVSQFEIRRD